MSVHHRPTLNASRKRARKRALAARDGAWCAYCGHLFADLRHATIDHVVPVSLYRTWRAEHTVLACRPCNQAKADRLPLLLALLVLDRHGHPAPDRAADPNAAGVGRGEHVESGVHAGPGRVFTPDLCALLARLAGAAESASRPDRSADRPHNQSRADQPRRHHVRTTPIGSADAVNTDTSGRTHPLSLVPPPRPHAHVARGVATGPYAGLEAA